MTPFRRWLIRGFFLTLLLLWVVGWAVSTCYDAWGGYIRDGQELGGGVGPGWVGFAWAHSVPAADGWSGLCAPQPFHLVDPNFWWNRDSSTNPRYIRSFFCLVGFSYEHVSHLHAPDPSSVWHTVGVPFWFLLVVTGVALRWAWRRTVPPLRGFPVEVAPSMRG